MDTTKLLCLNEEHLSKQSAIQNRLHEFAQTFQCGTDKDIFSELAFCVFAANTSARHAQQCVEDVKDVLMDGTLDHIRSRLEGKRRFWNIKSAYLVETRDYLKYEFGFKIKEMLMSFHDSQERRDFLAENKRIKGIGYKESSHFLRNVGFRGYAILDKHILSSLREFGVLKNGEKPASRKRYLAVEIRMKRFAQKVGIDMDELDLLLWSRRTGEILK